MTLINTSLLSILTNGFVAEKDSALSKWREGGGRVSYFFSPREEEPKQIAEYSETSDSEERTSFIFWFRLGEKKPPDFDDVETMVS